MFLLLLYYDKKQHNYIYLLFLLPFQEQVSVEYAKFQQEYWRQTWQSANIDDYQDESVKRHLKFLKQLGTSALNERDLVAVRKCY